MTNKKAEKNYIDLTSPLYYLNRELSLIEFQKRVLAEAEDQRHPIIERLKFISILSSNLDEFFMIRVAGLKSQIAAGVSELSVDGMTPQEQLHEIRKRLVPLFEKQEHIFYDDIIEKLQEENIFIHYMEQLTNEEIAFLNKYFVDCVMPVLTPLSLDPAHPFPRLINRSLNIAFMLSDGSGKNTDKKIAFLQVPSVLPRFVKLERPKGINLVLIEQLIKTFAGLLFPGLEIEVSNTFRITRDADVEIAEDEAEDLLQEIAEQIKHRKRERAAVRLEVSSNMPDYLTKVLMKSLELEPDDVYMLNRPLNLPDFMGLLKIDKRNLKDIPFQSRSIPEFTTNGISIFDAIKKKDFLVHHPFDSFSNSVLKFLNEASTDPSVLAIKITLYRTGINSPIVEALKKAAENGKDVTAFVELKARFDEENNIIWAKELEHCGAHVVYGIMGLKTHCKIAVIVRKEANKLKTYIHLSTGNYNYQTSKLYTDVGFFTSNEEFGTDAMHFFNYLTGYSYHKDWKQFLIAPINLRRILIEFINREAELHTSENPGLIIVKMNSLAHDEIIQALYKASRKGVRIKLLVRGVCCLRPGIPDISDTIEVRSILGRFLEHSRIFYFRCGGKDEYYLSSADWMSRNLQKRVELMFPIHDTALQKQLKELLDIYWKDNTKSWELHSDGSYHLRKPSHNQEPFIAQEYLLEETKRAS
ncbi:MAG: polyphosphate kinase 1, partial [FCB group bacterium]